MRIIRIKVRASVLQGFYPYYLFPEIIDVKFPKKW
jgi:hypothetical protein